MLGENRIVSGVNVFEAHFKKAEPVFVPGRPHHALTFRRCGRISIITEEETLLSGPGCVTFVPQGCAYRTEVMEPGTMIAVHFTTAGAASPDKRPEVFRPEQATVFQNRFASLLERYRVGREQDYACLSMFYEILAAIEAGQTQAEREAIPPRMRAAKRQIDRGYGDSSLSVSALAAQAGVSEVYFRREFRQYFGMPPLTYLRQVRLDNARLLLRTGYYSVGEVAARCGFESLSYFSSEFHRVTGRSPTGYMREQGVCACGARGLVWG